MVITEQHPPQVSESDAASMGVFLDWRANNRTLTDVTLWGDNRFVLEIDEEPEWMDGVVVCPNFFQVLQLLVNRSARAVPPQRGRARPEGIVLKDAPAPSPGSSARDSPTNTPAYSM